MQDPTPPVEPTQNAAPEAAPCVILFLHRGESACWLLVPSLLARVKKFGLAHEKDPERVEARCRRFQAAFGAGSGDMLGAVYLQDGRVVGHFIAGLEVHEGERIAYVYQWTKDTEIIRPDPEVHAYGLQMLAQWGQSVRARRVVVHPLDAARERLFERLGFTGHGRAMWRML